MQLVVRHGDAVLGAGTGQADNVFGTDVGGENGSADDPPAQIAAGQKIISGVVLASFDDPPGHAQENAEVKRNGQPVKTSECRAGIRRGREGSRRVHLFGYVAVD